MMYFCQMIFSLLLWTFSIEGIEPAVVTLGFSSTSCPITPASLAWWTLKKRKLLEKFLMLIKIKVNSMPRLPQDTHHRREKMPLGHDGNESSQVINCWVFWKKFFFNQLSSHHEGLKYHYTVSANKHFVLSYLG